MNELNIALIGHFRSGKDLAAEYLAEKGGLQRVAFADELKTVVHSLFTNVDASSKPRKLYQDFGQYARSIDPDVWVNQLAETVSIEREMGGINGFVLTDVRYENEAKWAKENGFVLVYVHASEEVRLERARLAGDNFDASTLEHETERGIRDLVVRYADYRLYNNGTKEDFYLLLGLLVERIKKSAL